MPYAQGRTFFDADSHIMELPDFLTQYADPAFRDRIPQIRAVPGELAKKLDELLARKAHAFDLPFNPAIAKAPRHDDAMQTLESLRHIVLPFIPVGHARGPDF